MSIESKNCRFDAARPVFNKCMADGHVVLESSSGKKVKINPREFEAVEKLCSGVSRLSLAESMMIAEGTVKNHLHAVFRSFEMGPPNQDKSQRLVSTLVSKGFLTYEPRIRDEKTEIGKMGKRVSGG